MDWSKLSDIDLLCAIVGKRESQKLYSGALHPLFVSATSSTRAHTKLLAARELVKRWLAERIQNGGALQQPSAVRDYLRLHFAGREHESFVVLFLDAQNRLIVAEEMFRGTLTQTSVYPREVVKRALAVNAGCVIFAHNHPSGVAEPSHADESLTQALKQALALVDVKALDHFIVAGTGVISFAERGLI